MRLMDLCMSNAYFIFNGRVYLQIFGTPMGSSLSPISVELVMDLILYQIRKRVKLIFDIDLEIKKYVDDLFLLIPIGMEDAILSIFNEVNAHIQFTCEIETNCCLPYLDMLVRRDESTGRITTNWYRKPVASGRLLNYQSFHPFPQKLSTAKGFIHRVLTLSSPDYRIENERTIVEILTQNGFPKKLIHRLINVHNRRTANSQQNSLANTDAIRFYSMPYVAGLSERYIRAVKRGASNVSIALRSNNKMGRMFSTLKDKLPPEKTNDVNYTIPCIQCTDSNYIGTT